MVVTFLPNNQRVEDQAFGRTARQGKRGTGMMIINANSLDNLDVSSTFGKNIKSKRDQLEAKQLDEFAEKELKLIRIKDSLFDKFCNFLNNDIRLTIRKRNVGVTDILKKLFTRPLTDLDYFNEVQPTTEETCLISALEEQWANFLAKLDHLDEEDARKKCQNLINELKRDFENDDLIKNPYYYITIGNDILVNSWTFKIDELKQDNAKRAMKYFEKAVRLEDKSKTAPGAAHVGIGWCQSIIQEGNYKDEALQEFKKALVLLSNEMSSLNSTEMILNQRVVDFTQSDLYKQMNYKATILGSYIKGVDDAINAIKRSKRLIDIVAHKKEVFKMNNDMDKDKALKFIEDNKGYCNFRVTFNHLTSRDNAGMIQAIASNWDDESGVIDQALKTMDNSGINKDIKLNFKQMDLNTITNSLFKQDKTFDDLTRDSAISTLQSERSYLHSIFDANDLMANLRIHSTNDKNIDKKYSGHQINDLIDIIR